jgi:hypothetical protein
LSIAILRNLSTLSGLSPEQLAAVRRQLDPPGQPAALTPTAPQKPIWEVVAELRKSAPPEEFLKLPKDGAEQLDHYLYGSPKRPAS